MADDAFNCIESLLGSVPAWIADLESILNTAAKTQEEILFASQPAEPPPSPTKCKSKSSSLKSKRSRDADRDQGPTRPRLPHMTDSDALRLSQRKRKTASVCSGSGPLNFRNKRTAMVYYDGETQKRFEKLVRAIGSSRNAIRKGKLSAKVDMLSRTGSSCSDASISSGGEDGDFSNITAGLKYKRSRPRGMPHFARNNDGTEAFDKVDARLERAQSLCERAAHQVLRDGDCTLEIKDAKKHFAEALRLAELEVPVLRNKAQKAEARRRRIDERQRVEQEHAEEQRRAGDSMVTRKFTHATADMTFPSEATLEVDELEVDDASHDDEGELNISDLRFGRFAQMRSTKLTAH